MAGDLIEVVGAIIVYWSGVSSRGGLGERSSAILLVATPLAFCCTTAYVELHCALEHHDGRTAPALNLDANISPRNALGVRKGVVEVQRNVL